MGITLKDVAQYANVSVSTVSRVINQKGNISEETTQRVEKAIAELMYQPSPAATLLSSVNYKIAIIAPGNPNQSSDGYPVGVDVNALVSEIEAKGHIPLLSTVKYSTLTPHDSSLFKNLAKGEIDGVILCDSCDDDKSKKLCIEHGIPYISTNGISVNAQESYVDFDNADGAYQAISYLHSLGHRKIGIISGPVENEVTKNRLYGVYKAVEDLKMNEKDIFPFFTEYSLEGGEKAAQELVKNKGITAAFCFSDRIAISVMATLRTMNIQIPKDISLIGFDNTEICKCMDPPLTSVKRFSPEITPIIVRSIIDRIQNPSIKKIQILYNTELVIRGSCRALRENSDISK